MRRGTSLRTRRRPTLVHPTPVHPDRMHGRKMPEPDENGELGGLARSIDALFSQRGSAPPGEEVGESPPLPAEQADVVADAGSGTDRPDPSEPFDARDARDGPDADPGVQGMSGPPPLPEPQHVAPSLSEAESEAESGEEGGPPPLPGDAVEGQAGPAPGPPPSALSEAVDAFLAGHPGAGAEVHDVAEQLRERLSLDPLADAVERLVDAVEGDEDDPALEMAAKVVNPAVASRLVQRMAQADDEAARAEYVVRAQRLGIVMANAFKGALTDAPDARTRRACHEGLIAMGETSRPVIEAMVEDDNRFLVQSGVAILGEIGGEGAVELVTSALANTDFRVRREAVAALAKLGGDESGQLVMASLEDPDPTVRAAAAEAAGRLGLERSLRPILAVLEADDLDDDVKVQVQVQALRGLGYLGDPGAVQAIEKRAVGSLFSKPSTEVRVAAYQALHEIGTPHARELIEKAREDKDPVVRTTVRGLA